MTPTSSARPLRHVCTTALLVVAVMIAGISLTAPAGAAPKTPQVPKLELRFLRVVDEHGHAFRSGTAGVIASTPDGQTVGTADAKGIVRLAVKPLVKYRFFGFARNTGWGCGYVNPDGTGEYFFSDKIQKYGIQLLLPTTFVVRKPNCSPSVPTPGPTATLLNGETGTAFPVGIAGLMACTNGTCVFAGTDANGVAQLTNWTDTTGAVQLPNLDPNVAYTFSAWAQNPTGWDTTCAYTPDNGATNFFFSANVTGHLSDVVGTTFSIYQPTCPPPPPTPSPGIELHILRADDSQPFALGGAGVWTGLRICPLVGCVSEGSGANVVYADADATGNVVVPNLDPAVQYVFRAMARNVDGWSCPAYTDPNTGENYWFAPHVTGTPSAVNGTTFHISDNNCSTTVTVLNGRTGNPFPTGTAGLGICPVVGCVREGPGANVIYAGADVDGKVTPHLDPAVQYDFQPVARNVDGWNCPGYTDPNTGDKYWGDSHVTGTASAIAGRTLYISDNC